MRILALILSIIIFHQSLSVCGPRLNMHANQKAQTECKSDKPTKSCCAKNEQKQDDHKDQDGCCGDNCKCLTCAKVFLNNIPTTDIKWSEEIEITNRVIYPLFTHSYDFHPSIAYPPNV